MKLTDQCDRTWRSMKRAKAELKAPDEFGAGSGVDPGPKDEAGNEGESEVRMCTSQPCRLTSAGCPTCDATNPTLPDAWPGLMPGIVRLQAVTIQPGCICPPTSEQTCENSGCPRQNHFSEKGKAK